jgi:hypothetical protein
MNSQHQRIISFFLLILLTLFIGGFVILGKTQLNDGFRFGISFIYGVTIGSIISILFKSYFSINKLSGWNYFSLLLTLLSILVSITPDFFYKYASIGVDNLYDKSVCFNYVEELDVKDDDEFYVFFAFDKTKYKMTSTISPSLQNAYEGYISDIRSIYPDAKKEENNISYREFCRAKMCSDLLKLENSNGYFSIITIEEDIIFLVDKSPLKKDYIKDAIIQLYRMKFIDNDNTETDFLDFYKYLISIIPAKDNRKERCFNKYVLYAYSDFFHDRNPSCDIITFNDELKMIKKYQDMLESRSLIQNMYVVPCNNNQTNFRRKIVDDTNPHPSIYLHFCQLSNFSPIIEERAHRHHRLRYLNEIPVYQSNSNNECSPRLFFSEKNFFIRLTNMNSLKPGQQLNLKMKNEKCLTEDFIPIDTSTVSLLFTGHTPSNDSQIFLDITNKEGVHGLVRLDFKEAYPNFLMWLIPFMCFISGVWMSIFLLNIIFYTNNNDK